MFATCHRASSRAVAAALLLAAVCSVHGAEETPNVLSKIQSEGLLVVPLSSVDCNAETTQPCVIQMKLSADGRYCVAMAPTVKLTNTSGGGQQKKVAWELDTYTLGGKPLAFSEDAGIVIAYSSTPGHVEKGGPGDGGTGAVDKRKHHAKVNRNKTNATSSYLPVVVWGPPGSEELCAAIDPKIVNVN